MTEYYCTATLSVGSLSRLTVTLEYNWAIVCFINLFYSEYNELYVSQS